MKIRTALPFPIALCLAFAACAGQPEPAATHTPNAEAKRLYDQARALEQRRTSREEFRNAEDLYQKAIALDSNYAPAYAGLARIHAGMVHFMYEPTDERRRLAREAAETALKLAPELGDAHYGMGTYWYWGMKRYAEAAAEFEIAAKSMPESAEIQAMAGFVQRRRGNWRDALTFLERAVQMNARPVDLIDLGDTYAALGRIADGREAYRKAMEQDREAHHELGDGLIQLRFEGQTEPLRKILAALPPDFDPDGNVTKARFELAWIDRRADEAILVVSESKLPVLEEQTIYWPASLLTARAHRLAGRNAEARKAFEAARAALEPLAAERQDDARIHVSLGAALAGLGRFAEAAAAAELGLAAMPRTKDALNAQQIMRQAAAVYADIGQAGKAVALLKELFAEEAVFSYSRRYLTMDPLWDKIRNDAGFKGIIAASS